MPIWKPSPKPSPNNPSQDSQFRYEHRMGPSACVPFVVPGRMFQPWRYQLREAQLALSQGRLEETERLISTADLVRYLPGKELLGNLAAAFTRRAGDRGQAGDFVLAWRDLKKGRELGGQTDAWLTSRDQLVQFELD